MADVAATCASAERLVEAGEGEAFAPAGKVFREWVLLPRPDRARWSRLLEEALTFAKEA
jgi:hypothetical protein